MKKLFLFLILIQISFSLTGCTNKELSKESVQAETGNFEDKEIEETESVSVDNDFLSETNDKIDEDTENMETISFNEDSLCKINLKAGDDQTVYVALFSFSIVINKEDTEKGEALKARLIDRAVDVNDIVISAVREKTYDDIQSENALENLKIEILTNLKNEFDAELICDFRFDDLFFNKSE